MKECGTECCKTWRDTLYANIEELQRRDTDVIRRRPEMVPLRFRLPFVGGWLRRRWIEGAAKRRWGNADFERGWHEGASDMEAVLRSHQRNAENARFSEQGEGK